MYKISPKQFLQVFLCSIFQCEDLLTIMGVSCVKSFGEAEALCAQLNEDGVSLHFSCVYYLYFFSFAI
jgi:hypothetical protein